MLQSVQAHLWRKLLSEIAVDPIGFLRSQLRLQAHHMMDHDRRPQSLELVKLGRHRWQRLSLLKLRLRPLTKGGYGGFELPVMLGKIAGKRFGFPPYDVQV